jgi:hypothetical protein
VSKQEKQVRYIWCKNRRSRLDKFDVKTGEAG